jgi:hypothetical protein
MRVAFGLLAMVLSLAYAVAAAVVGTSAARPLAAMFVAVLGILVSLSRTT